MTLIWTDKPVVAGDYFKKVPGFKRPFSTTIVEVDGVLYELNNKKLWDVDKGKPGLQYALIPEEKPAPSFPTSSEPEPVPDLGF